MTNALKKLLTAVLAMSMTASVGLFATACNTDPGNDDTPPTNQGGGNEGGNQGGNEGGNQGGNEGGNEGGGEGGGETTTTYKITLHAGAGSLEAGAVTEYTTTAAGLIDLKGADFLPEPTIATAHWHFDNWYDAETGGNPVNEAETVFTADTDLYAVYVRDDGVWNGDGSSFIAGLSRNTGETTGVQYWLGAGTKIDLEKGDVISLYMNGKPVTFNVHAAYASSCIENASDTTTKVTSVTVSEDANFAIYLWDYANESGEFWSCQFFGTANSIPTTSTIPQGCEQVKVTGTNGTATLYLVINGVAVNSENGANYHIHGWQDSLNNIFGSWGSTPTLESEIEVDAALDNDLTLMFYWDGGQSGNVSNIKVGKTFIVKIVADKVTVKEYDVNGPEDNEEEVLEQFVLGEYYLVGQGFKVNGESAQFKIVKGFEIGEGITVDLTEGNMLKAVICTDAISGGPSSGENTIWKYNEASFYRIAVSDQYAGQEDGFIVFSGGNNVVKAAGSYTITVDKSGETPVFVITPANDVVPVEPDTTEYIVNYYIKGQKVTNWGENTSDATYKMTYADGNYTLTIALEEGDEFMFYSMNEHPETHEISKPTDQKYIQAGQLADGVECVTKKGSNFNTTVAGTYSFTYNVETDKLTVTVVADTTGGDAE